MARLTKKTKKKFSYEALKAYGCQEEEWTLLFWFFILNHNWEPSHVAIGLFEIIETSRVTMAIQANEVLLTYGLNVKILTYVKDESNNLSIMTSVLIFVVSYELLGLTTPCVGGC
jgi:hypothetical protein